MWIWTVDGLEMMTVIQIEDYEVDDVDDASREENEKEINFDIICNFMNATCIAALLCSCSIQPDEEVDKKKIYFGNDSRLINKNGMVTYAEIKRGTGAFSGLTLEIEALLKEM